jgi:hypothetical protein
MKKIIRLTGHGLITLYFAKVRLFVFPACINFLYNTGGQTKKRYFFSAEKSVSITSSLLEFWLAEEL